MIPEIGHFALIMALVIATVQMIFPIYGSFRNHYAFMSMARPAAQAQFVFVAIAFACLTYSFIINDWF